MEIILIWFSILISDFVSFGFGSFCYFLYSLWCVTVDVRTNIESLCAYLRSNDWWYLHTCVFIYDRTVTNTSKSYYEQSSQRNEKEKEQEQDDGDFFCYLFTTNKIREKGDNVLELRKSNIYCTLLMWILGPSWIASNSTV